MQNYVQFLEILNQSGIIRDLSRIKNISIIQKVVQEYEKNHLDWINLFMMNFPQISCIIPIPRQLYYYYVFFNGDRLVEENIGSLLSQYYITNNLFQDPVLFALLYPKIPAEDRIIAIELFFRAISDTKIMNSVDITHLSLIVQFLKPIFNEIWEDILNLINPLILEYLAKLPLNIWQQKKYYISSVISQGQLDTEIIKNIHQNYYTEKKIQLNDFIELLGLIPSSQSNSILTGLLITEENEAVKEKIKEKINLVTQFNQNFYSNQLLDQII